VKRVVLVSGHYFGSTRRAGFHWLARAYQRLGWDVVFVTGALSRQSRIRGDFRFAYPVREEANRLVEKDERLRSYVLYTPYHPANFRLGIVNRLSAPLLRRYARAPLGQLADVLPGADLVIFESTPALLLVPAFRAAAPQARFVYRVSDDLRFLKANRVVLDAEHGLAPTFDLVSVPSEYLLSRWPDLENVALHHHAVDTSELDRATENPFPERDRVNVVFAGNSHFDNDFLERAARAFPEWRFHIFGPIPGIPDALPVVRYGERPFSAVVPYLQHADIGLQPRSYSPGAESLSDSLKVLQYTYCRLPIVAPAYMRSSRANVFPYRMGDDESIRAALLGARAMDRATIGRDGVASWEQLAGTLAEAVPTPLRTAEEVG
jgi:2-beta-glucuronyltransferase